MGRHQPGTTCWAPGPKMTSRGTRRDRIPLRTSSALGPDGSAIVLIRQWTASHAGIGKAELLQEISDMRCAFPSCRDLVQQQETSVGEGFMVDVEFSWVPPDGAPVGQLQRRVTHRREQTSVVAVARLAAFELVRPLLVNIARSASDQSDETRPDSSAEGRGATSNPAGELRQLTPSLLAQSLAVFEGRGGPDSRGAIAFDVALDRYSLGPGVVRVWSFRSPAMSRTLLASRFRWKPSTHRYILRSGEPPSRLQTDGMTMRSFQPYRCGVQPRPDRPSSPLTTPCGFPTAQR